MTREKKSYEKRKAVVERRKIFVEMLNHQKQRLAKEKLLYRIKACISLHETSLGEAYAFWAHKTVSLLYERTATSASKFF